MFEAWWSKQLMKHMEKSSALSNHLASAVGVPTTPGWASNGGYTVNRALNGWIIHSNDGNLPRVATSDGQLIEQLTSDLALKQLMEGQITPIKATEKDKLIYGNMIANYKGNR